MIRFSTIRHTLLSVLLLLASFGAYATNPVQSKSGVIRTTTVTTQTLTVTLTSAVATNDSVVVTFAYGGSTGTASITSVTDDKGDTYTQQLNQTRPGTDSPIAIYTALAVTTGPKTLTIVTGNSVSATMAIAANVYEDTNTVLDTTAHGTTTNSTAFAASFTTAAANESAYAVVGSNNGAETYTQNNGWTQGYVDASDTESFYFNIPSLTSSGSNSLNMTASTAVYTLWGVIALKAGSGGACTHAGYTSGGAIASPNGTTGSYVGKFGAFVTPDCATINYWQPTIGNFGTN